MINGGIVIPIENERKYILYSTIEDTLKNFDSYYKINQGYIQNSSDSFQVRFRKSKFYKNKKSSGTKRVVTIKSGNSDFTCTEIETDISKKDFNSVWEKTTTRLKKYRYKIPEKELFWEIDVFKNSDNKSYFWMAEVELPEGLKWPTFVPDYIKENLLYKVPIEDGRFSSKKLSDPEYAMNLFRLLSKA